MMAISAGQSAIRASRTPKSLMALFPNLRNRMPVRISDPASHAFYIAISIVAGSGLRAKLSSHRSHG
jgi:hypothetical protein